MPADAFQQKQEMMSRLMVQQVCLLPGDVAACRAGCANSGRAATARRQAAANTTGARSALAVGAMF